jgi:hypothetical protein
MPALGYRKYVWDKSYNGYHWSSESYWAKVDKRSNNECWPWLGSTGPQGGLLGIRRQFNGQVYTQMTQARRVALAEHTGIFPAPRQAVFHVCQNKLCQNPSHFILRKPCQADYDKFNSTRFKNAT